MYLPKVNLQQIQQFKEKYLNRNIVSYLICVAIASILWFLNTLSKDYLTEITYPVKYTNFPAGKYPVAELPTQIQLTVKAKGFALLGHSIRTSFLPITFNVGSYCNHALSDKAGIQEFILNTNDIKDKISSQLNTEIQLQSVAPEEIVFQFAQSGRKKVAIRPIVDYTLKRQYIVNQITVAPDSTWIEGPVNILDTLHCIPTELIKLKNISKNITRTAELVALPYCTPQETAVEVDIQVEQFTEARKIIPITPLHVPDSLTLRLFPDNVNISYEIGLSKYDKITASDFIFSVDYPKNADVTYLEVKVVKAPDYIKNLSYTPQKVEYILEKR